MVYMFALKFLFSVFICMELVTVSFPTNHAMWSKTSQLLPGTIWIYITKAGCNFYYFHWTLKQGNWQGLCFFSFFCLSLCLFHLEKVTLILKSCRVYSSTFILKKHITQTGNIRLNGTLNHTLYTQTKFRVQFICKVDLFSIHCSERVCITDVILAVHGFSLEASRRIQCCHLLDLWRGPSRNLGRDLWKQMVTWRSLI